MFTRMLAADTAGEGLTANAVSPYVLESDESGPDNLPDHPASFEDVTRALRFLIEEDADHVSGANIDVSGGWFPEEA